LVVYTSARSPLDYCEGFDSLPLPLLADQNENVVYNLHMNVHETTRLESDPDDLFASAFGASKSMMDIDLNYPPPLENDFLKEDLNSFLC